MHRAIASGSLLLPATLLLRRMQTVSCSPGRAAVPSMTLMSLCARYARSSASSALHLTISVERTARSSRRSGFGREAMNRIQNHKEGGIASVYDRHQYAEENKRILETVGAQIMALVEGAPRGNVVPFAANASL